jgi:hypothetical protein
MCEVGDAGWFFGGVEGLEYFDGEYLDGGLLFARITLFVVVRSGQYW